MRIIALEEMPEKLDEIFKGQRDIRMCRKNIARNRPDIIPELICSCKLLFSWSDKQQLIRPGPALAFYSSLPDQIRVESHTFDRTKTDEQALS